MMPTMKIVKIMGLFVVTYGYSYNQEAKLFKTLEGLKRFCRREFKEYSHYHLDVSGLLGAHNRDAVLTVYKGVYRTSRNHITGFKK